MTFHRMAEPFQEGDLLAFLRQAGSLTTTAVAGRFGWTVDEARDRLKRLQSDGTIVATLEPGGGPVREYVWSAIVQQ